MSFTNSLSKTKCKNWKPRREEPFCNKRDSEEIKKSCESREREKESEKNEMFGSTKRDPQEPERSTRGN